MFKKTKAVIKSFALCCQKLKVDKDIKKALDVEKCVTPKLSMHQLSN